MGKIDIQGGIGAGILILMLLGAVLIGLPALRWFAFPGIFGGLVVGGGWLSGDIAINEDRLYSGYLGELRLTESGS